MEFLMPIVLGLLIMTAGLATHHGNVALCGGMFFALSAVIMVPRQQAGQCFSTETVFVGVFQGEYGQCQFWGDRM